MRTRCGSIVVGATLAALQLAAGVSAAQTPEQQSAWDAERVRALAEQRTRAERLEQQRAARKADVMAWVHSLDPMASGGWEFRAASSDASWAAFSTVHQLQHSGGSVTVWLRQEYAEPQQDPRGGTYLSIVQRIEYDCLKNRARPHLLISYGDNNLRGVSQSIEMDPKQTHSGPIVPGTLDETNFQWACSPERGKGAR